MRSEITRDATPDEHYPVVPPKLTSFPRRWEAREKQSTTLQLSILSSKPGLGERGDSNAIHTPTPFLSNPHHKVLLRTSRQNTPTPSHPHFNIT